jgi:hypothetical protein
MNQEEIQRDNQIFQRINQEATRIKKEQIKEEADILKEYRWIKDSHKIQGFVLSLHKQGKKTVSVESPHRRGRTFDFENYTEEQKNQLLRIIKAPIGKPRRNLKGTTTQAVPIVGKRLTLLKLHFPELCETPGDINHILN